MTTEGYKRMVLMVLCAVLVTMLFPVTASADVGPKPSIRITFENIGYEPCYATLLSKHEINGPWWAWDGDKENVDNIEKPKTYREVDGAWRAFVKYEDKDGYYFLQETWLISEENEIEWTYYPPNPFKILLYYPETDTYAVSSIYGCYTLHTQYIVDMAGIDPASLEYGEEVIFARHSYRYGGELVALFVRILLPLELKW